MTCIDPLNTDKVVLPFLQIYTIILKQSFDFGVLENFSFFLQGKKQYLNRFFLLYQYTQNADVKLQFAIVFSMLGVNNDCWIELKEKNIIIPARNTIYSSLKFALSSQNYKAGDPLPVVVYEVLEMLYFVAHESTFMKLINKEYYNMYIDLVLMLYYSYHESYRQKILYILQTFTYCADCKAKIFMPSNHAVVNAIKRRIISCFKKMKSLVILYEETELHNKHFIKSKPTFNMTENNRYIQKYEDNVTIYGSTLDSIKSVYFSFVKEFGLLLSVYTNLLASSELTKYSEVLLDLEFYNTIKEITEYFQTPSYFNKELDNKKGDFYYLTMYTNQLIMIQIIFFPNARLEFFGNKNTFIRDDSRQYGTLLYLYNLIKLYKNNENVLHKLIFCVNRYLESNLKFRLYQDILINIIKELLPLVYSENTQVMISRECLKLFLSLSQASDNLILGVKANSKKLHLDTSNYNDIIVAYKDPLVAYLRFKDVENLKSNHNVDRLSQILYPPYKRVFPYKDNMGVIFHSGHGLVLPFSLDLGNSFTIFVRIFNPFPKTDSFHVLIQDSSGLGAILAVDKDNNTFGTFTVDGEWIPSGINLRDPLLQNRWLSICFAYSQFDNQSKLVYYLNGDLARKYEEKKYFVPTKVKYIANSVDFIDPFGIWCDLRIYSRYKDEEEVFADTKNKKTQEIEVEMFNNIFELSSELLVKRFLTFADMNDETFRYFIKLLNNFTSYQSKLNLFTNISFILKVADFMSSARFEVKKDISKFILSLS